VLKELRNEEIEMTQGKRASIRAWQRAVRDDRNLTAHAKLVLYTLAVNSTADAECTPSIRKLAEDSGLSRNTVRRHMRQGEELGFVVISTRSEDRTRLANQYRLAIPSTGNEP